MGRPKPASRAQTAERQQEAIHDARPLPDSRFNKLIYIIPSHLREERIPLLKNALHSSRQLYHGNLETVPADGPYLAVLKRLTVRVQKAAKLAAKSMESRRTDTVRSHLLSAGGHLAELRTWDTPLGKVVMNILSQEVGRLPNSGQRIENAEQATILLKSLAELLSAFASGIKAKSGPSSKRLPLRRLMIWLDVIYRVYSWNPRNQAHDDLISEIEGHAPPLLYRERDKRDRWVAEVMSGFGVSYPSLEYDRDKFRSLFKWLW